MKESIASAFIIVFLCSLSFLTLNTTTNFCNEIKSSAYECISKIEEENWKESEIALKKAQNKLKESAPLLKTFCVHKDVNDIENTISALRSTITSKNKDESLLKASSLIYYIEILSDADRLTLDNIL